MIWLYFGKFLDFHTLSRRLVCMVIRCAIYARSQALNDRFTAMHAEAYTAKLLVYQSLCCAVTTQWLDSDYVVTVVNFRQNGDYIAIGSSVTVLPAVSNGDKTVTVQSPCSHCAKYVVKKEFCCLGLINQHDMHMLTLIGPYVLWEGTIMWPKSKKLIQK